MIDWRKVEQEIIGGCWTEPLVKGKNVEAILRGLKEVHRQQVVDDVKAKCSMIFDACPKPFSTEAQKTVTEVEAKLYLRIAIRGIVLAKRVTAVPKYAHIASYPQWESILNDAHNVLNQCKEQAPLLASVEPKSPETLADTMKDDYASFEDFYKRHITGKSKDA